jgi:hypothetical protein
MKVDLRKVPAAEIDSLKEAINVATAKRDRVIEQSTAIIVKQQDQIALIVDAIDGKTDLIKQAITKKFCTTKKMLSRYVALDFVSKQRVVDQKYTHVETLLSDCNVALKNTSRFLNGYVANSCHYVTELLSELSWDQFPELEELEQVLVKHNNTLRQLIKEFTMLNRDVNEFDQFISQATQIVQVYETPYLVDSEYTSSTYSSIVEKISKITCK